MGNIITPILWALGWGQTGLDVKYEYPVGGKRGGKVDIALLGPDRIVALLEAKAPRLQLQDHVGQVVQYAFQEGTDVCALTNGIEWWLYLPREPGPFQKNRFAVLNVEQAPIDQLVDDFEAFLGRDNLVKGRALSQARRVLEAKREADRLNIEIPNVWNRMKSEPDQRLVTLVGKRVYEDVGLRPTSDQVAAVLSGYPVPTVLPDPEPDMPPPTPQPEPRPQLPKARPVRKWEKGSKPTAIRLWGTRYDVRTWKAVLVRVAEVLYERHGAGFDLVTEKRGKKYPWASRNLDHIPLGPKPVGRSGIYILTGLNAAAIMRRADDLLELFGHHPSDLEYIYD